MHIESPIELLASRTLPTYASSQPVFQKSKMNFMKKRLLQVYILSFLTLLFSIFSLILSAQTVVTFSTPGANTWLCPAGVTSVQVECWGAGGAGGGAPATNNRGGGGGGGAYTLTTGVAVIPGTTYSIAVGAGMAGTTAAGLSGLASSFNFMGIANPGTGGGVGSAGAAGTRGLAGTYNGGNGAAGNASPSESGAGGGGAGSGGAGGNASGTTAGSAGGIDGGVGGVGLTGNGNGAAGSTYGGGGGGARTGGFGTRIGGRGADGFVRLTFTPVLGPCVAPTAQPTSLILTPSTNDIFGSFTASASASRYLVIRTATAAPPTNPVDGTTYTAGTSALGGFIESAGTAITFNSTGLSPSTQYWYWVYAYNAVTCSGGPLYRTAGPLTGNATTLACGVPVNTVTLTNATSTTLNWSALPWSLGHLPTACESALITLNRSTGTSIETIIINLDVNISVFNFSMINASTTIGGTVFNTSGTSVVNIGGNMRMETPGANRFHRCVYGNVGSTTIQGNVILGRLPAGATDGHAGIGSTGSTPGQQYTLYGNMVFNPRGYTTDEWAVFNFNKAGTQFITNNTVVTDTIQPVLFETLNIGTTNATTVIMNGTAFDAYIENVRAAGVTIGVNSTLDLPANYSLNKILGGFPEPFNMLAGSRLRIGGDKTIERTGMITGVAGSNFPASFSTYSFNPTSTVEYYGADNIIQTIYDFPDYQNLILSNGTGINRAQKITTAPLDVFVSFSILGRTDLTLGVLGSTNCPVNTVGPLSVAGGVSTATAGGLYCNANVISGTGTYAMGNFSTLGSGHPQGIATSGATGNLQMAGTRTLNSAGNYVYNGIVNQIVGAGIPGATNDFIIDNPGTVTTSASRLVRGVTFLRQGTFDIGTTIHTCETTGTMASLTGKMKADLGTVQMRGNTGAEQNLSGNWFVNKTISTLVNANTRGIAVAAAPADTLLISTLLSYGSVNNSEIITNDNLTLLSTATGTANFGDITNAGANSGNIITGRVNIERFLPARSAWRFLATPVVIGGSQTIAQAWRENNAPLTSNGYGTRITGPTGPFGAASILDEYTQRGSLKSFNSTTNAWVEVTNANSTILANTKGILVFVRGDRSKAVGAVAGTTNLRMKGSIRTGNQIFAVPANKFESFGNPYPARIDFRTVTKTFMAAAYTVWNPNIPGLYNVGGYQTYILNAGEYRLNGSGVIRNFIESGEAVFVQSNSVIGGLVTVRESDKASGSALVSRPGVTIPTLEVNMYSKDVTGADYLADGVMLNFNNSFSPDVDNMDVRKILNTYDNISIKNGAHSLVVERRPNIVVTDTIKLSTTGLRIAPYRFEIDPSVLSHPGMEAFIKDKFLQIETPVSFTSVTTVSFEATADAASRAADRFMIVFKQMPTTNFTTISATRNADKTVTVNWGTQNESNVNNYTVEQSNDGTNFTSIATKAPIANNGTNPTYSQVDAAASKARNWYRVKANNTFGAARYSNIAMVNEVPADVAGAANMSIYPNPVTGGLVNVHLENQPAGKYNIQISNKAGQVLQSETIQVVGNNILRTINIGSAKTGTYQVMITNEAGNKTTLPIMVR